MSSSITSGADKGILIAVPHCEEVRLIRRGVTAALGGGSRKEAYESTLGRFVLKRGHLRRDSTFHQEIFEIRVIAPFEWRRESIRRKARHRPHSWDAHDLAALSQH